MTMVKVFLATSYAAFNVPWKWEVYLEIKSLSNSVLSIQSAHQQT